MTAKSVRFLLLISTEPGILTAEIHRRIGHDYAHGHARYTYETVKRLHKRGFIERFEKGWRVTAAVVPELRK